MRLRLDTQAWLWFVLGDRALSSAARSVIEDEVSKKLVSAASFWEIAIKISLGKYVLAQPYEQFMSRAIEGQGFHRCQPAVSPPRSVRPAADRAGAGRGN